MRKQPGSSPFGIWALALGYFAFYVPYTGLTKALSLGALPGMTGPVPGLVLLPTTVLATTAALLLFITASGGWRAFQRRRVLGLSLPTIRLATLCSGVATAVIIGTTTLNYTFGGISILLALLLMRGGVLGLSPVVDTVAGRPVRAHSWAALALSLAAVGVAFAEVDGYRMTLPAALNIAAYLTGYIVRLNLMTSLAKSEDAEVNRRYFLEETAVAALALTAIPALVVLVGRGEAVDQLRAGFTSFLASDLVWPAILVGLLYACLYVFGTGIYLDARENTYCIPLNRCASLLSGLAASYVLAALANSAPPSRPQLAGAGLILIALVVLMLSTSQAHRTAGQAVAQRVFLFVCSGNTSRSPMAQAICNAEVAAWLGLSLERAGRIKAVSAGLTAQAGRPFAGEAVAALRQLPIEPHAHASQPVTSELVGEAELVFCMTEAQREELIRRFPEVAAKAHRLDPDQDVDDPSGKGEETFRAVAALLQRLVRKRLAEFAV
jgi:protein-tyrosine-phosphatase